MQNKVSLLLFFFLSICFKIAFSQLSFDHLSVSNGLSQSAVLSICKDSRGYMWFGTRDCLNRYDGRTIKIYKNDPNNPKSISSEDYIYAIAEDLDRKMWIGTQKGLNYYHPEKESFEQIYHVDGDKTSISGNSVVAICVAKNGNIWFGTSLGLSMLKDAKSRKFTNFYKIDGLAGNEVYCVYEDSKSNIWVGTTTGLSLIKPSNDKNGYHISNFYYSATNSSGLSGNFIKTIVEDRKGRIWIGTEKDGINLYQPETNSFSYIKQNSSSQNSLSNNFIRRIAVGEDGKLWIATMSGLNIYNQEKGTFEVYKHDSENRKSLSDNSIKEIYRDEQGSVWIGTNFGGVNVAHKNTVPFTVFKYNKYTNSISSDNISVVAGYDKNHLLIGTEGYGLNYFNTETGIFKQFKNVPSDPSTLGSNTVKAIYKDKNKKVWIGLYEGGLDLFNPETSAFTHYKPNPKNPRAISHGYVSCITEDKAGNLWIGTSTKGLNLFHPETQDFTQVNSTSKGLKIKNNYIKTVLGDSQGNLWVGTATGLNILRKGKNQFEQFVKNGSGLKSNYINCIKEDRAHNIWVGAFRGGLSLYQSKENKFVNYTTANGLASNNVVGIEQDDEGNIWVSTDRGLSKFDQKLKIFKNYFASDGLPGNEFNNNATFKSESGTLYFGSYDGLVAFRPQAITTNKLAPKMVFTALRLFNKPVEAGGADDLLDNDISFTKKITFKADQNIFTIDFAALNYIKPGRNKYAYKLDGFEEDWNEVTIPSATYTNLPAGTYSLLIKGSNNDGVWTNTPTKLIIRVLPAFWKTWWAYILYAIAFGYALFYFNRFFRRQERLETELYYEHINSERQKEVYQSKFEFFTRISHEIRTPLTLIFAPLEKLIQNTKSNPALNTQLQNIKGNTERLLRLISELLDFRKIETGNLQLQVVETEMIAFCATIYNAYQSQAEVNQITFNFEHEQKELYAFVDRSQIEKVLYNLLSNAFKFTRDKGHITLKIIDVNDKIEISVIDNGIGIPYEHQEAIFTNFHQVKDAKHAPIGWGIGLALVKNIVDLHKGFINLSSKPETEDHDGYTEFKVSLLKGSTHFNADELTSIPIIDQQKNVDDIHIPVSQLSLDTTLNEINPIEKQTILVVEDNDELRAFIIESLQPYYNVTGSTNGAEGLAYALENIPEIIISDVTMPVMGGYEFCEKIKTEERTSHIPVIMLTAMASDVHQVSGLQSGADMYITKPFNLQVLELSIRNLLLSRESMKARYSRQVMLMPRNLEIESPDEKFLDKLMQITEDRMENSDFNVAGLVAEMAMSQTVLYKKIKALTDLTITDFIKSIRLKRAAQLLQEGSLNISDIAYSVGFNDRKYFSKEFKKQFGKNPSDYGSS